MMRRLLLPLLLLLISALVACGGTSTTAPPAGQNQVITSASGSGATQRDPATVTQGVPEDPAFKATAGLILEEVSFKATGGGGYSFSGKVVNRGQEALVAKRISLDLLDGSGQVAAVASFSTPKVPLLQPGETATWQGSINYSTKPWQSVQPTVEGAADEGGR